MEIEFLMRNSIHINGTLYDAPMIMEEIMRNPPPWKLKGLEFLMQLLDPSNSPVKFHTSGTTGTPKEISFSKQQILYSAENTCRYFGIDKESRLLLCLPAGFVAGSLMLARALVSGGSLTWNEPSLQPLQQDDEIDFAAFTPAQVMAILKDSRGAQQFDRIKKIIIGGGEISQSLENELKKKNSTIYATYGMTETLTHIAVRKIGEELYHAVYPDVKFGIDDHQCLVVDLPFIANQQLVTSDIVELIDDHSFKWKGRKDHVINSGGLKIHPEEIEAKLVDSGLIQEGGFYISSQSDPQFGELPVIVLLKQYAPEHVATFLERIKGLLNKHETVKAVIILDKFEYTSNGKLKRQKFT
jgi:o-succinylbenzoate---CoA ligase